METIRRLIISVLVTGLILACGASVTNKQENKYDVAINFELVDSVEVVGEDLSSPEIELDGKTFYYLDKSSSDDLVLNLYEDEFEMKKYVFEPGKFIDGENIMEPSEWNVIEKTKVDSTFTLVVSMIGNDELVDTLRFQLCPSKGFLYHIIGESFEPIILIDSKSVCNVEVRRMEPFED